jgi:hypothetical protein
LTDVNAQPPAFSADFLMCMNATHLNHVKAGESRTKFTGIWMVVVDGRIFARFLLPEQTQLVYYTAEGRNRRDPVRQSDRGRQGRAPRRPRGNHPGYSGSLRIEVLREGL